MELKLKIFLTNWINVVGIFLAVYIAGIVSELIKIKTADEIGTTLAIGFIGGIIGIFLYGAMFWAGFIMVICVLDFTLMNANNKWLKLKLVSEWAVISGPFISWFFQYDEWIFLVAVIAFFFTQLIRERRIVKIVNRDTCRLHS